MRGKVNKQKAWDQKVKDKRQEGCYHAPSIISPLGIRIKYVIRCNGILYLHDGLLMLRIWGASQVERGSKGGRKGSKGVDCVAIASNLSTPPRLENTTITQLSTAIP